MTDTPKDGPHPLPEGGSPSARARVIAACCCCLVGLWLAMLPYLAWWRTVGDPAYFADSDDLLYLSVAGQSYENHPTRLGDPPYVEGGSSIFPWLQFVPGILIARALGLGPIGIDVIWRISAGITIGLGTFLVLQHFLRRPVTAAAVAILLMADAGYMFASVFLRQATVTARLLAGRADDLFESFPQILPQYRLITPGLSIVFLLVQIWLIARARENPTWPRMALSGLGFGLLFHTYFYYWTAAGVALGLAWVLDSGHRRPYFHTGWIGGLIGVPSIVTGMLMKGSTRPDWLHRTDNFLPIARTSELLFPKLSILLVAVSAIWVLARRRDLLYLWSLSLAALLLTNHQLITGLQIQNFHWFYVYGPCLSILLVLSLGGWLGSTRAWSRPAAVALTCVVAADLGLSSWLRWQEATRTRESITLGETYRRYRAQRKSPATPPLAPNAILAGDDHFVEFAIVLENQRPLVSYIAMFSPTLSDDELGQRTALNAILAGTDRSTFERTRAKTLKSGWGPWVRDEARRNVRLAFLMASFDAIANDPVPSIRRFHVGYVARPASETTAPPGTGWSLLQDGPSWRIWQRPIP